MSDDLIEHYAGFTIKAILHELKDGGWMGDCILIQDATKDTYGPYEGSTVFATRDEAKQAAFALAKDEIDN